ncbi:MAG: GNAT family N-acetyltransferase [Sulfitobacter sp.]|nr:GNAT family N-acetyltransferase [Sulfitobacter sp.]
MDEIELRRFESQDRDWLVEEHQSHYTQEEGFDETFGPLVGGILDEFLAGHDPERERGWIVWCGGRRLGSIFCVKLDAETAKLRLFLLQPEARGRGLGRRMLETCMDFARDRGYQRMKLWTHESHRAAGALYAKNGWTLVETKKVVSFGKPNVEQYWEIDL